MYNVYLYVQIYLSLREAAVPVDGGNKRTRKRCFLFRIPFLPGTHSILVDLPSSQSKARNNLGKGQSK